MAEIDLDKIKQSNPIQDVIGEDMPLAGRGRWMHAQQHDSLVVDVRSQAYHWNSMGEHGDVFSWVMKRKGVDFKTAVEMMCKRAGLPEPDWGHQDAATRLAARARADAFTVALEVFKKWLQRFLEAQEYAIGRGWSQETIERSQLGYTGPKDQRKTLMEELRGELGKAGVDVRSPAAVALIGYSGNVAQWGTDYHIQPEQAWVEHGWIPGIVGTGKLVYPHLYAGMVRYYSTRGIHEKDHYNLNSLLAGERQLYFNVEWPGDKDGPVFIVEGQADAISLAQWHLPAIALCGVEPGPEMTELLKKRTVYVGLDADKAGTLASNKVAAAIGPMTRIFHWSDERKYASYKDKGELRTVKDANDLLRAMAGVDETTQNGVLNELIFHAVTFAEAICLWAGAQKGARRDDSQRRALAVVAQMEEMDREMYRTPLAKALGIGVRDLDHMLKSMKKQAQEAEEDGEPIQTLGGMIGGYLVEYTYDLEDGKAGLAWRTPDGKIEAGESLHVDGKRYIPMETGQMASDAVVLLPSGLGPLKSTRELAALLEIFIAKYYLLENRQVARILAYYALFTWLYDCFDTLPYLTATGDFGSGKSELMKRVGFVCYRMLATSGATSAAAFFRVTEMWRGTVFIDEADLADGGDMANNLVKFLNTGAMKGTAMLRLEKSTSSDGEKFLPVTFSSFCPKLLAMRKLMKDSAVTSRSIVFKLMPRETIELKEAGVPLMVGEEFRRQALALRNMLLRWRLEHWQKEILTSEDDWDMETSARLNQVTLPLLAIAKDDPELRGQIRSVLRELYAEQVLDKSMSLAARVLEALWKIRIYPDLQKMIHRDPATGQEYIFIKDVAKIANQIIDSDNSMDGDDHEEEKKKSADVLKARGVGHILRNDLMLHVMNRTRDGYPVIWDDKRIRAVSKRYGVKPEEIGSGSQATAHGSQPAPDDGKSEQGSLLDQGWKKAGENV